MCKALHELELAEFFRRGLERRAAARANTLRAAAQAECRGAFDRGIAELTKTKSKGIGDLTLQKNPENENP